MAKLKRFEDPNRREKFNWINEVSRNADYIRDGVWDITDIEYINVSVRLTDEKFQNMKDFVERNPNFVIAEPYQTEYRFWLSEKPTVRIPSIGSGFNYGSNNIIDIKEPKTILICAEND